MRSKKGIHLYFNAALWKKTPCRTPSPSPAPPPTLLHLLKCSADYSRACWELHAADCQAKSRSPCAFYAFELPLLHFSNSIWDQPACRQVSPEFFCLFCFVSDGTTRWWNESLQALHALHAEHVTHFLLYVKYKEHFAWIYSQWWDTVMYFGSHVYCTWDPKGWIKTVPHAVCWIMELLPVKTSKTAGLKND